MKKMNPGFPAMSSLKLVDTSLVLFLIAVSIYPLYEIISHYTEGDQVYYRLLYERFAYASSLGDIFNMAESMVSSREVVSPLVLWLGSYLGINKDIYVTFLNVILLGALILFLRKNRVGWVVVLLCLVNYYLIVLYTGAERLKIGYMFILFAALSAGRFRVFMLTLSMLSHFQMILMVLGLAAYFKGGDLSTVLNDIFMRSKIKLQYLLGFCGIVLVCGVFLTVPGVIEGILSKGTGYLKDDGVYIGNLFQFFALAVCFGFAKRLSFNINFLLFMLFFFMAIVLLGGERANMIFFTSAFAILVIEKKLGIMMPNSWPFLLILLYLSVKSIKFIENIFTYGNGFYGV